MSAAFCIRLLIVDQRQDRIGGVVMLLNEHRNAILVETIAELIDNRDQHPFVSTQYRRDCVETPGRLKVETAAGIIAAIFDGA